MQKNEGYSVWDDITPPTNICIDIDANTNPMDHISAVIHELFHIVLYPFYVGRMTEDYYEVMVLAYENDMYAYVKRSKDRLAKWNALISQKLTVERTDG